MIDFSNLIEWFKTTPRYLFAATLVSGTALFLPNDMVNELGLAALRDQYRPWLGGVFLVAGGLLAAHGLTAIAIGLHKKITVYIGRYHLRGRLHNLTPREKSILFSYLKNNSRTLSLEHIDGVVLGLAREGIISQMSASGNCPFYAPFNINSWVWKYLWRHPKLVGLEKQDLERT